MKTIEGSKEKKRRKQNETGTKERKKDVGEISSRGRTENHKRK